MIGHRRAVALQRSLLTVASLSAILMLSGCSGVRQALGLDHTAPDEFAVESRAPLTVPPDFDLRPPQPGATRPQELTAAERAQKVIEAAGPGKPGDQASFALKPGEGSAGGGLAPNPEQQVVAGSLAEKVLGANDSGVGGTVQKRDTEPLKGVY